MFRIAIINGGVLPQSIHVEFPELQFYESVSATRAGEIARYLSMQEEADAIICVTGLAEFIRPVTSLPVYVRDPSGFDVLCALRQADLLLQNRESEIVLVLHENWRIDESRYRPYLTHPISVYYYRTDAAARELVEQLAQDGVEGFVGGPDVNEAARKLDVQRVFLQVGETSLRQAIRQVYDDLKYHRHIALQNKRLEKVLDNVPDVMLVANDDGAVTNFNESACTLFCRKPAEMLRCSIQTLFSAAPQALEWVQKKACRNKLIELEGKNWFLNVDAFVMKGHTQGVIVSLRSVDEIEDMEHKYRRNRTGGMVARFDFPDILTYNARMLRTKETALAFAAADSTVLIRGETGCGKELFAHSIHNHSLRKSGPFVAVNCAALPENLLESELLGYEEGAFTSAKRGGKAGLFEMAHTGTIFLDEISQVPLHMQGAILRVIQEKQVLRLGGSKIIPVDVRVLAATNENLLTMVKEGRLRQDLYYRLNVLQLYVPPLRERRDDIQPLITHYYHRFTRKYGAAPPMSEEALSLLEQYAWPGNVRELINCVERYVIVSRQLGTTDTAYVRDYLTLEQAALPQASSLPPSDADSPPPPSPAPASKAQPGAADAPCGENELCIRLGTLSDMDRQIVSAVLERCRGNKQKAAGQLDISRPTLWKKFGSDAEEPQVLEGAETVTLPLSTLKEMELRLIRCVLERFRGSKTDAAAALGLSRTTLWKRLQESDGGAEAQ